MTELIGATAFAPPSIKQQLLVFDRIAWPISCWVAPFAANKKERDQAVAEREFLIKRSVVFSPNVKVPPIGGPSLSNAEFIASWVMDFKTGKMKRATPLAEQCDQAARDVAIYLRDVEHVEAVPITAQWTRPEQPAKDVKILEIVIKELPVPDDSHSIEDVLAFRDEMKQQNLMQGLRVWMNEVAAGKLRPSEISTKLDFLIHEHAKALELHRMKRANLTMRRWVVTIPEVLEYVLKARAKELFSVYFDFKEKDIALREEESKLVGKEVGYIVRAQERFA
jgi:hypothetical protein